MSSTIKRFTALLLLFPIISCLSGTNVAGPKSFTYHIDFYPAFIPSCHVDIIKRSDGTNQIKLITVRRYLRDDTLDRHDFFTQDQFTKDTAIMDSTYLTESDLESLFKSLGTISLATVKTEKNMGLDGITIRNIYKEDSNQNTFEFWSPDTGTKEYAIADAVLQLCKRKFKSEKELEYFKLLEEYFQ